MMTFRLFHSSRKLAAASAALCAALLLAGCGGGGGATSASSFTQGGATGAGGIATGGGGSLSDDPLNGGLNAIAQDAQGKRIPLPVYTPGARWQVAGAGGSSGGTLIVGADGGPSEISSGGTQTALGTAAAANSVLTSAYGPLAGGTVAAAGGGISSTITVGVPIPLALVTQVTPGRTVTGALTFVPSVTITTTTTITTGYTRVRLEKRVSAYATVTGKIGNPVGGFPVTARYYWHTVTAGYSQIVNNGVTQYVSVQVHYGPYTFTQTLSTTIWIEHNGVALTDVVTGTITVSMVTYTNATLPGSTATVNTGGVSISAAATTGLMYAPPTNLPGYSAALYRQGDDITHYVGKRYAVLMLRYGSGGTQMLHAGAPTPATFVPANRSLQAQYHIPTGAAYGHFGSGSSAQFVYNQFPGRLGVDFANRNLDLWLRMGSHTHDAYYEAQGLVLQIGSDNRSFSNHNCASSGNRSGSGNCGGRVLMGGLEGGAVPLVHSNDAILATRTRLVGDGSNTHRVETSSDATMRVFGSLYGSEAQEMALAIRHEGGGATFNGGALGAQENPNYMAFLQAEHAVFGLRNAGLGCCVTIGGTLASNATVNAETGSATYTIAADKAGGKYITRTLELPLRVAGGNNALVVNFSNDSAVLNLRVEGVGASAHSYQMTNVPLRLNGNRFEYSTGSGGTIAGTGLLAGYTSPSNMQIEGNFYGSTAQEAAGFIRQGKNSGADVVHLGFAGAR